MDSLNLEMLKDKHRLDLIENHPESKKFSWFQETDDIRKAIDSIRESESQLKPSSAEIYTENGSEF